MSQCTAAASDQSYAIGTGSPLTADARLDDASKSGRDPEEDGKREPGLHDQGSSSDDEPVGCSQPAPVRLTSPLFAFPTLMPVVRLLNILPAAFLDNK